MKLNQTFLDRKAGVVAIAAGTMLSVFRNHLLYLGDHLDGLPSLLSTVIEILWIGFIVWICIVSTSTISANIAQDTFKEFNSNNALKTEKLVFESAEYNEVAQLVNSQCDSSSTSDVISHSSVFGGQFNGDSIFGGQPRGRYSVVETSNKLRIGAIDKIHNKQLEKSYDDRKSKNFKAYETLKFYVMAEMDEDRITSIAKNGLKIPIQAGGFGRGCYFTSNPYSYLNAKKTKKLLVCKVAIGNSMRLPAPDDNWTSEKIRYHCCDSIYCPGDSNNGGGYDEFVLFDRMQAYPQYIIHLQ